MNLYRLKRIIKAPYILIYQRLNPVGYAKRIGVQFEGLKVYGKVLWGTEPWLIKMGRNVHITNNVTFITHDGGTLLFRDREPDLEITKPISIGNNVYIGTNTTILPGVKIGNNVIIGACSVVTKDIPNNAVVAGNPAKYIKSSNEYFEKIKKQSIKLGHLSAIKKEKALKQYYNIK